MMAPEYYIFTGRDGEVVPGHVTHVRMAKSLKVVPAWAFYEHPNIEEVECHDGVEDIDSGAFARCSSLRRVMMPGVKNVWDEAFYACTDLNYIECGKLEIIWYDAFIQCESLRSIDMPSIMIVRSEAFGWCKQLRSAKFGRGLESLRVGAFCGCRSLERIALPLKDGMITDDAIFMGCEKLNCVDLTGGVHETVAALLMDEWKNDMNEEIDAISQILLNTDAGSDALSDAYEGEKAEVIRSWIRSVLRKIIHYKAEHSRYLNVAAATLQHALPNDIVCKNVIPFLELPSYTFEVEGESDEEDDNSEEDEEFEVEGESDEEDDNSEEDEDEGIDDQNDENRHRFCCLRKLWPCPTR